MTLGYREKLSYDTAWGLDPRNHPEKLLTIFKSKLPPEHLRSSSKRWIPWLFIPLIKSTAFFIIAGILITIIHNIIVMADPIFLKIVVDSVEKGYPLWFSLGLILFIAIATMFRFSMLTRADFYGLLGYLNIQSILMNIIYAKAIKLPSSSRIKYSGGELVNLISTDVERIRLSWFALQDYFYAPFMVSFEFICKKIIGLFETTKNIS